MQWFITDGRLSVGQQTLFPSDDAPLIASTSWTAPPVPATVHGWVVVTDARSGVVWTAFSVDVES